MILFAILVSGETGRQRGAQSPPRHHNTRVTTRHATNRIARGAPCPCTPLARPVVHPIPNPQHQCATAFVCEVQAPKVHLKKRDTHSSSPTFCTTPQAPNA